MKIPYLDSNVRTNTVTLNNRSLHNLRSGQQLHALVLSQTNHGLAKIRLGPLEVTAKTDIKLSPGEKLVLEVMKSGTLPELKVLRAPDRDMLKAEALRGILPNQLPIAKLIENLGIQLAILSKLSNPQTTIGKSGSSVSPAIRGNFALDLIALLRSISAQSLNTDEAVTAKRLRQLLSESGLFLESRLASGLAPLSNDLKASLLRLLHLLRQKIAPMLPDKNNPQLGNQVLGSGNAPYVTGNPLRPLIDLLAQSGVAMSRAQLNGDLVQRSSKSELPGGSLLKPLVELLSQSEAALSRVRLNQLISLPVDDETHQLWQFEIPVNRKNQTDSFQVRIEQKKSASRMQHDYDWVVIINFDLQALGPISAHISLQKGEISSHFTAEKEVSAKCLQQELPKLHQALLKAGLKVGILSAHPGNVKKGDSCVPVDHPLLDEKA